MRRLIRQDEFNRIRRPHLRASESQAMKIFATLLIFALCASTQSKPTALQTIYDARRSANPSHLGPVERRAFYDVVIPAARIAMSGRRKECREVAEALDVASGSFTATGHYQHAILYRYCEITQHIHLNGVAIVEDGKIVAHVVFDGHESRIGALPDLNNNGRNEILISGSGGNMGEFYEWVSLVEILTAGVTKLGRFEVGGDGCGLPSGKVFQYSKRLLARKGPQPEFFAETYDKDCKQERGHWIKQGTAQRVQLDKNESEYRAVR
jgi:hypothetical protein